MTPFEGTCFKHLEQAKKCSNTHAKAPQYNTCNLKVYSVRVLEVTEKQKLQNLQNTSV